MAEVDVSSGMGRRPSIHENEEDQKAMDEDALKKIFQQIDSDKSGSIDVNELQDAMRIMGVKCSANSAKKVLKVIDTDGNGTVEWNEFYDFFMKVRNPEEIKQLLSSANQKFLDYKNMVEGDPSFGKRFYMPPMLSGRQKYMGHNDNVEAVCWLPNDRFASCAIDGDVMIWDANDQRKNPTPVSSFTSPNGIYCMAVTTCGKYVFCGTSAKADNVLKFDVETGELVMKYKGHSHPVFSIGIAKDQQHFVSGDKVGLVTSHSVGKEDALASFEAHESTVYGASYNDDSTRVCTCSADGQIKVWDLQSLIQAKLLVTIEDAAATGVVFQCLWRGQYEIISCGDDYCIKRWDIRKVSDGSITNYFGHTSPVKTIGLSEDQKFMVSATHDGSIRLWLADELHMINEAEVDAQNRVVAQERELEKLQAKLDAGEGGDPAALTKAQSKLATLKEEESYLAAVRLERESMSCLQARVGLEGHSLPVVSVAWRTIPGTGEAQVLTGSQDQTIRLFDIDLQSLDMFERWSMEEEAPESRKPTKEAYRRTSMA